jgi:MFS family permease
LKSTKGEPAVRRLAIARMLSMAGTDASAIALSYALYNSTGSPLWLSAGILITFGLSAALAPLGGWIADHFRRRRVMTAAEVIGACCFALLVFDHGPVALLSISVVATMAGVAFGPASAAAVPTMVEPDRLAWANGRLATAATAGKTVGRIGSGLVIAAAGYQAVFLVDSLTFVASALLIRSIAADFGGGAPEVAEKHPAAPWRFIARHPLLAPVMFSWCIATFMTSFSMTAETVLVFDLQGGSIGLGLLAAGWGLGMVAGSWLSGRWLHEGNEPTALFGGRLLMGLGILAVGLSPVFWPTVAFYVVGGAAGGLLLVAAQSILQRHSPAPIRGRLMGVAEALRSASFAVGALSAGFVIEGIGAQRTYLLVGLGVIVSALPVLALVRRTGGPQPLRPGRVATESGRLG